MMPIVLLKFSFSINQLLGFQIKIITGALPSMHCSLKRRQECTSRLLKKPTREDVPHWTAILKSEGVRIDINAFRSCLAMRDQSAPSGQLGVDVGAIKPQYLVPRRCSTTTVCCLSLVP